MWNKTVLLICAVFLCIASASAADIPITVSSVGTTYIEWSWLDGYTITTILIDGIEICGYEETYNKSLQGGYLPGSLHTIYISNGVGNGSASAYTTSDVDPTTTTSTGGDGGGIGLVAGVVGGMIGAIILIRRGVKQ